MQNAIVYKCMYYKMKIRILRILKYINSRNSNFHKFTEIDIKLK